MTTCLLIVSNQVNLATSKEIKKHLSIPISRIREYFAVPLRTNMIPKVVAERIYNTISLFNEGIDDLFLFNSFLELLPFINELENGLTHILKLYSELEDKSLDKVAERISYMATLFNRAWRNRYYASYRLGDISDFNLEYKGGIQQLVSAFDGIYKIIAKSLCDKYHFLTIIMGDPRIKSTDLTLELNYYDVFKPEFFVARAMHEIGETILSISGNAYKSKYKHLFDIVDENVNAAKNLKKNIIFSLYKASSGGIFEVIDEKKLYVFFRDIFGDICARRLTYSDDIELFIYWFRNIALTDSIFWLLPARYNCNDTKRNGNPNDRCFFNIEIIKIYLLRIFIQINLIKPDMEEEKQIALMNKYWSHYKEITPNLLIKLRKIAISLLGNSLLSKGFNQMNEIINERIRAWPESIDISPNKPLHMVDEYPWIIQKLTTGSVVNINKKDLPYPYHFVQSLFKAYLVIIKELGTKMENEGCDIDPLLYRDTCSNSDWINRGGTILKKREVNIYYDRRGGNFIIDSETRRKYFRTRSAFIRSIWDLVSKWKYWMPELNSLLRR